MLFLFDIDGTLIRAGGAGMRALERASVDVFGQAGATHGVDPDGKTDPLIIAEMFAGRGTPTAADVAQLVARYLVHLEDEVARSERFHVLPGVPGALDQLAARGMTVGLATGNVEDGARIKLTRGGLWHRFPFGGYGSDASARAQVVACAIQRGERHAGRGFPKNQVFVIGDTPRDVAAAHACDAVAIAVATGPHQRATLEAAGADFVWDSLEELPGWLAGMASGGGSSRQS